MLRYLVLCLTLQFALRGMTWKMPPLQVALSLLPDNQ